MAKRKCRKKIPSPQPKLAVIGFFDMQMTTGAIELSIGTIRTVFIRMMYMEISFLQKLTKKFFLGVSWQSLYIIYMIIKLITSRIVRVEYRKIRISMLFPGYVKQMKFILKKLMMTKGKNTPAYYIASLKYKNTGESHKNVSNLG